jgi:hypothetical protein
MKRYALLAGLALFIAIPATDATAQVSFGPQVVVWDFEEIGIGGRVDFGLGEALGIEEGVFQDLFASFNANYLFADPGTTLIFNINAAIPFAMDGPVTPYAGAGLNHFRFSFEGFSSSHSGLNVLGGIFFDLGALPAFAELQYSTTGAGFLSLSAGVLFGGS